MKKFVILFVIGFLAFANVSCAGPIKYPEKFRNWTHVKSMLIQPGHALENPFQGIHHIYANTGGLDGMENGFYSDGSKIVFDLLQYKEGGNAIQEGERKLVGIMVKDAGKYKKTGGWGFEAFDGDSKTKRLVDDGGVGCFNCHNTENNKDYVFSKLRK